VVKIDKLSVTVRKRIFTLFILVLIFMTVLLFRTAWVQVFDNNKYQNEALDQRLREVKVEPKRGVIYDQNGVELAVSASSDTVVAAPKDIEKPQQVAQKLAGVLDISEDDIYQTITKDASAVYVQRKVSEEQTEEIQNLDLGGVYFTEESKRFYPKGNLGSHLLGFAGVDSQGLQGIEYYYDRYLRGDPGKISIENDAIGRKIPDGIKDYVAPDDGNNIYLTIDNVLQYIAERELDKTMKEHQAQAATIVMMNPETGGVLALANRPTYDPNNFADYSEGLWRNRAISDTYEPGSTFKIVTASAALEEGVVHPTDKFYDPGHIEVAGQTINCWKDGGHGKQTFAEVVENSCNPGFVQVGQRIGEESFDKYIRGFGFGKKSNIDLPGEATGLLYSLANIGPVELATISFGHGISVTPIQLATAVSAVANDGQLLEPHLVQKIEDKDGDLVKKNEIQQVRKVISKETAATVRKLLTGVVEEGSGAKAKVEGYKIGGKTGTAKHYGQKLYDASFVGMLPADDPKLVALVVVYGVESYPYYGSQVAAPIFHNIVKDAVRYLEIPPGDESEVEEEVESIEQVEVPNLKNLSVDEAEKKLAKLDLQIKLEGRGTKIIDQVPESGVVVNKDSTVILFFSETEERKNNYEVTVPDFKGLKLEQVRVLLSDLGLEIEIKSSGNRVWKQEPQTGFTINSGDKVKVWLN
jgi:stage V sporulation protein D (sporulation-specific penicillin-binding protein)